jgi:DNA-binding transcriptional MerR regulator
VTLANWNKRGFLKPSIRDSRGLGPVPRLYTFRDLIAIRVAAALSERGIEVHKLTRVVAYLRKRRGLNESTTDLLASTMLVTDGEDVYEVQGDVAISTLRKAGQRVLFILPLGEIVTQLQTDVRARRVA